jgi:diguanylate cyclase (GGDEF)-like protein
VQLPARLRRVFRDTDYIIRWGGEEFLVVARGTSRDSASERCERILAAVSETEFDLPGGVKLKRTCSIGYAPFPLDPSAPRAATWSEAVDLADKALYAAKRGGRNRWAGPDLKA